MGSVMDVLLERLILERKERRRKKNRRKTRATQEMPSIIDQ